MNHQTRSCTPPRSWSWTLGRCVESGIRSYSICPEFDVGWPLSKSISTAVRLVLIVGVGTHDDLGCECRPHSSSISGSLHFAETRRTWTQYWTQTRNYWSVHSYTWRDRDP